MILSIIFEFIGLPCYQVVLTQHCEIEINLLAMLSPSDQFNIGENKFKDQPSWAAKYHEKNMQKRNTAINKELNNDNLRRKMGFFALA